MTRKVLPIAAVLLLAACVDTPSTRCGANFCADVIRDTAGGTMARNVTSAVVYPVGHPEHVLFAGSTASPALTEAMMESAVSGAVAGVALGAGLATAKINPAINATIKP